MRADLRGGRGHHVGQHFLVANEIQMVLRQRENRQSANLVQQSREQRAIGLQRGRQPRKHHGKGRDIDTVLPNAHGMFADARIGLLEQALRGKGDDELARRIEAQSSQRFVHGFAAITALHRCAVCHLDQLAGQPRFGLNQRGDPGDVHIGLPKLCGDAMSDRRQARNRERALL